MSNNQRPSDEITKGFRRAPARAMLRAATFGNARIMIPMVTSLSELTLVRALVREAEAELDDRGELRADDVPIGVMIEVPSAAIMADDSGLKRSPRSSVSVTTPPARSQRT